MSSLTIRYSAPAGDPLKLPRPHFVNTETHEVVGGECGSGLTFHCIHQDLDDPQEGDGPILLDEVIDDLVNTPDCFDGWFAAFTDSDGETFSVEVPISRLEYLQ